ncbi:uncharacterized protein PAN0_004c2368 [Moesziomyces antarcticus]|uniref:Uncharacterized protein n=2 Tax=Pseudozyma antarctica TaxID=84753 RepID=A0A081CBW3_PSEA2|nr:uncharacterized protein PAN0_004c2368 [Moesziomyces antarcticus]GAK64159.1 conserved hypothetical protein [Moesziomyces antarcticus]SPO44620.1 uncharacterized protein PSANT_02305 [Moesziomyces antarcticus]
MAPPPLRSGGANGGIHDDEDEFDLLFDDQALLDPELEESLAQAEATYTASQAVQPAAPAAGSSFRLHTDNAPARSSNRRGAFVPPAAKKPRLDPGPSRLGNAHRPAKPSLLAEPGPDQVIVRDLREDEDFEDKDDDQWWATNNALDQVEEEAIRMSQHMPTTQPNGDDRNHEARDARSNPHPSRRATTSKAAQNASKEPPDTSRGASAKHASANVETDELDQLRAEIERLRAAQRAQDETVDKLRQDAYRKAGEVAVVRQNLTKLNQENAKLREREVQREHEHRASLERLQKDQEKRLQRLETETAFRRVEQDTSRRIWPSSVARLPPVGLRDMDRRQESQVRAGLTTPTKANRYGLRGSGSSGNRQRFVDTPGNRQEPSTPTRSAVKPAPHFPRPTTAAGSASKSKAFRGLQNSFADFAPVQEKIRQQRSSPTKPGRAETLAPADWDADQTVPMDMHDDQDVVMADDGHPSPQARPASRPRRSSDSQSAGAEASRHNEYRYLAAVSEILHQRTTIVSLLLSHESPPAAAPATYPASAFNTSASGPSAQAQETSRASGTLSRLISADLVRDCPKAVVFRYRRAVETLLAHMSRATVMEPEEREDALRLLWSRGEQADADEMDFAFATMHLSHAVASALMVMAGILLRLCQTDLLTDVLRLVSCLIAILPRFWMDLECLQPDRQADHDEIVFLRGPDADKDQEARDLSTPIQLREVLAQSINDCRPRVVADTADALSRLADGAARKGSEDWTLSSEAREDLLQAVVGVLEAMSQCTDTSNLAIVHPLRVLQRHGALHKLLHPERPSWLIFRVVRMLSSAVSDAPLIHECLASKAESDSSGRGGSVSMRSARFPVLEVLVKHLVDRRFDLPESEWHRLHTGILTLLTQAALHSADTAVVLADSAPLLAALIRCLSLDADLVWLHSRPTFMLPPRLSQFRPASGGKAGLVADASGADLVQATERIVMDTRLLNLLYNYPLPIANDHAHRFDGAAGAAAIERMGPISLATKLDQPETYSMLNGIRQSFVVALSRIAFCSEPDWIAPERKMLASLLPALRQQAAQAAPANRQADDGETDRRDDMQPGDGLVDEVEETIAGLDRVSMLLEAIADVAGDLAELVLSPEEIDSIYDLLAADDDGASEHEAMNVDREPSKTRDEAESETESEPELQLGPGKRNARSRGDVDVIEIDDSD